MEDSTDYNNHKQATYYVHPQTTASNKKDEIHSKPPTIDAIDAIDESSGHNQSAWGIVLPALGHLAEPGLWPHTGRTFP